MGDIAMRRRWSSSLGERLTSSSKRDMNRAMQHGGTRSKAFGFSVRRLAATGAPRSTLLLRGAVGAIFVSEGIQKFLFPAALGAGRFEKIGIPAPEVLGPLVGGLEVVCGACVLLGIATRLAASTLAGIMVVALASTKVPILLGRGYLGFAAPSAAKVGAWSALHESRTDVSMLCSSLFLLIVGAGYWSLDFLIAQRRLRRGTEIGSSPIGVSFDDARIRDEGTALRFDNYPFEPASVFPSGRITPHDIVEVNFGRPTQIRLRGGEILFATTSNKEALVHFIHRHDSTVASRLSVWSSLLEPFLDTSHDVGAVERQYEWLARVGLDRGAVERWRSEVSNAMLEYNFGSPRWEWVDLNLYDVLSAQRAQLSHDRFADFYTRAMTLAALDPPIANGRMPGILALPNILNSIVLEWYPVDKSHAHDFGKSHAERMLAVERRSAELHQALTIAYSGETRRYHTLEHIERCLHEFAEVWSYAVHPNEVLWALVFHDAVYDVTRNDNEQRSAEWACGVMQELRRPNDEIERVRSLIMATSHDAELRSSDEMLLVDIDLSVLGSDRETFDAYDAAIRAEYAWVPAERYRQGRTRVLRSFLAKDPLFRTAPLRRKFETAAKANLAHALTKLETT